MSFPPFGFIMESILLLARGGPGLINTEHLQGQHSLPARALESCQGQDDLTGEYPYYKPPTCTSTEDASSEIRWHRTDSTGEGVQSNHSDMMILDMGHWKIDIRNWTGQYREHISQLPLFSGTVLKVPKKNLDYLPSWTNSAEIAGWGLGKSNLCIFLTLVMSISPSSLSFSSKAGISQPEFRLSLLLLYLFPTPLPPLQGIWPCQGMAATVPPISVTLTL